MAKKLFFVAFFLVLAIVSVDLFVNVSADPEDLVTGMIEGTANLAKGGVDAAKAGGEMMGNMAGKMKPGGDSGSDDSGPKPFGGGLFGRR